MHRGKQEWNPTCKKRNHVICTEHSNYNKHLIRSNAFSNGSGGCMIVGIIWAFHFFVWNKDNLNKNRSHWYYIEIINYSLGSRILRIFLAYSLSYNGYIRLKHFILARTVIILSSVPKSLVDFQMHLYTVCNSSNCRFNVSVAKFSTRNRDLKARQRTNKVGSHYFYYHWPFWNSFNTFLRVRFILWLSCDKNECRKDKEGIPLTPIFK